MATREAAFHCGQLHLEVEEEPFGVSICNCLACQRKTDPIRDEPAFKELVT
jgi:hypothetical protein